MRSIMLRGACAGAVYSCAYLLVELLGQALFSWLGGTLGFVRLLLPSIPAMLAQYLLLGLALGAALALPVEWLRRWAFPRMHRPWLLFGALQLALVGLIFGWADESVLERDLYAMITVFVDGLLLIGWGKLWIWRRVARRFPGAARVAVGLWGVALLLLCGLAWLPSGEPLARRAQPTPGAPNVLLIVVDTLRRDHVSAYGYERRTTPNLDALAAESTLYERAYTTAPWTLPAHASLFTGLPVASHGTDGPNIRLSGRLQTLASSLREHGYRTGSFYANPWVGPVSGLDQGFDEQEYLGLRAATDTFLIHLLTGGNQDFGGAAVTDRAMDWILARREPPRPFFAFLNYMEAHDPFGTVPEPYFSKFLDSPLPRHVGREWVRFLPLFFCEGCEPGKLPVNEGIVPDADSLGCSGGRWTIQERRLRQVTALYDAGVLYADAQIGRLLDALRSERLLDDTIVLITSDHGEALGEHGRVHHGVFLSEPVLAVPMLIRYPRLFPAGQRVRRAVSLVDVKPTLEALLGFLPEGASAPLLPSSPVPEDKPLSEYYPPPSKMIQLWNSMYRCDFRPAQFQRASLLDGRLKFVWTASGERELYDLEADPGEELNLWGSRAEEGRRMEAELRERLAALPRPPEPLISEELDPATKQTLESIGYIR